MDRGEAKVRSGSLRSTTKRRLLLLAVLVLSVFAVLQTVDTWNLERKRFQDREMEKALTAESAINGEMFKQLRAVPADAGTTAYESVKSRLMRIAEADPHIRFSYLYVLREGRIQFMVDSEPVDSPDYSPPGQIYEEASPEYLIPFSTGRTYVTEPTTDRWGTWISILVPILEKETGAVAAVFAMDYPASVWRSAAVPETVKEGLIMLFLILLLVASYAILNRNAMLHTEQANLRKVQEEILLAKDAAESATRAKSEFLANMSHEIRTPMNAVIGFAGLLKKTDMTPKQLDYVEKIDSSSKSLLGIINDILDFSKIEAGRLELEQVDFNLFNVINGAVGMSSDRAADKNIELLSHIANDVPCYLIGDPLRLGQVLINLVNNAVKFTKKGHVLVKAELVRKDDDVCRLRFSVNDSGIGMTKEQMEKLFAAFSQVDTSITRKYGGTGLGLSISKHLVELMNGSLTVESEYGVGSTFTFLVDLKIQHEAKHPASANPEGLKHLKVLVVDDNEMSCDVLKEQLESFGIHAKTLHSGSEAIEEVRLASVKDPYDLVLMDWRMPGLDGIETTKGILGDRSIDQTPVVIMVTAFGREEVFKRAEKVGISAFLIKPVNQSLLLDTLMNTFGIDVAGSRPRVAGDASESLRDLAGVHILLTEDNLLNQEVATEILKSAGALVDIANNGKEAVEAVLQRTYDAVLMDVQMPVMGGFEATRTIRATDGFSALPIIAMTAHAMQGAREDCLAAGMNDYISKPIDPVQLFAVLGKWVVAREPSAAGPVPDGEGQAAADAAADEEAAFPLVLEGIDVAAGLDRLGGNRKLYRKLLLDFARNYAGAPDEIGLAVERGDKEAAARVAHTVKGIAGNLSATRIHRLVSELEKTLVLLDRHALSAALEELQQAFVDYADAVKELDDAGVPTPSAERLPRNPSRERSLLKELARLVRESDVDADTVFASLKAQLAGAGLDEELQVLAKRIDDYDFEGAWKSLVKLADALETTL